MDPASAPAKNIAAADAESLINRRLVLGVAAAAGLAALATARARGGPRRQHNQLGDRLQ